MLAAWHVDASRFHVRRAWILLRLAQLLLCSSIECHGPTINCTCNVPCACVCAELIEKLESNESSDFYLFKILRAHILPLTNCAFNKSGDKFITGSYDRTCKVRRRGRMVVRRHDGSV